MQSAIFSAGYEWMPHTSFTDTISGFAETCFRLKNSLQTFVSIKIKTVFMELMSAQKRILVLDKDNRIQSVVDEISCYGDYNIRVLYDPNAVYNQAKTFKPDLIILDYLLLDGDCALICSDFKEDKSLQTVPIIIVTAYKTKKANADFYNCDALFIKPLDMQVLASRMNYLMAS